MPQEREIHNFLSAIEGEAEQRRLRIEKESRKYIAAELEKAEGKAKTEMEKTVARAVASIRSDVGRERSAAELENRAVLLHHREELSSQVFDLARQQLVSFVQGDDYPAFLNKLVCEAAKTVGEGASYLLRPEDMKHQAMLQQAVPDGHFSADETVQLGGVIAKSADGRLVADNSVEARLSAQHDWFLSACGLDV